MARDFARGLIGANVERRFFGPTPIPFTGRVYKVLERGGAPAVRVEVSGVSAYAGASRFEIHANDPLALGFTLPDRFAEVRAAANLS
jgi:proline racemase